MNVHFGKWIVRAGRAKWIRSALLDAACRICRSTAATVVEINDNLDGVVVHLVQLAHAMLGLGQPLRHLSSDGGKCAVRLGIVGGRTEFLERVVVDKVRYVGFVFERTVHGERPLVAIDYTVDVGFDHEPIYLYVQIINYFKEKTQL